MALNSSKNIDHGNYIPSPIVHGVKVADGEHIRKVFVLSSADVAAGAGVAEQEALVGAVVGSTGSPNVKSATEPTTESATEPTTESVAEPTTESVAEPVEVTDSSTVNQIDSETAPLVTEPTSDLVAEIVEVTCSEIQQVHQPVTSTGSVTGLPSIPSNIEVGTDASLDLTVIVLPGVSARIPLTIDLTGAHSEVRLSGIYLCSGHDDVTFDITMHHRTGDCRSQQTFNGLASGEAKCGFFGKIVIAPDAQRTEAFQENHNILLSDSARVNTKPRLEIYADDVKCSHGATVGKLNEDEQFYMRSRGIPEEEAKVLQMISFVAPVLETIPEEATEGDLSRSAVAGLVESAIRSFA